MKISFWSIGKGHEGYVKSGIEEFTKRLSNYFPVQWNIIPVPKNASMLSEAELKKREAETILSFLKDEDYLVALDERGKELTSEGMAAFLQQRANESTKQVVFPIGGAFGLDEKVVKAAKFTWSLSQLTFPHQLVRLLRPNKFTVPALFCATKNIITGKQKNQEREIQKEKQLVNV